jgi:hypothetical protein
MALPPSDPSWVRNSLDRSFLEQERRSRWIRRVAVVAGSVILALSTFLVVHVALRSTPPTRILRGEKFALPPQGSGCGGVVSLTDGAYRIPITFSRFGTAAQMSVNVCLDGQGPFPFIIDSGAAYSVIDVHLANRLHLPKNGAPHRYVGLGCTSSDQLESLASWSVAGLPLAPQEIAAQANPSLGSKDQADGLLGSDVLSRFGAVRFDFAAQTMTVPGTEGPAASAATTLNGPENILVPPALVSASRSSVVGLDVAEGPSYAEMGTSVDFEGLPGGVEFDVDTGSTQSVVDASLDLPLAQTHLAVRGDTVCSRITIPLVHSGRWSVGNVELPPLLIASDNNLGPVSQAGFSGLLGLDELSRFHYVVFDFAAAKLVLGAPDH